MCGIAGFWLGRADWTEAELQAQALRMADALRHRGPDSQGTWVDPAAGIALAHRRLAILDLSSAGAQPMLSASRRFVIVYNGEIYNHRDIRNDIEAARGPIQWAGHSDTETLLRAVDTWGVEAALKRSVGMFAFALWDRTSRTLSLSRDRFGEKPLYFGQQDGAFYFGSELKAICAHRGFRAILNLHAVSLLTRFNYVPTPHSIWLGVRKLAPGTIVTFSSATSEPRVTSYWSAASAITQARAQGFDGGRREAGDAVEQALRTAVRGQLLSDRPVGALLSGGIDSSTVVALMRNETAAPVRTFSVGFNEKSHDESDHAAAIAAHLATDHTELTVGPEALLGVLPRLPEIYDEPFADSSQVPTFLIAALARQHVTVALSGDGGDELFGGYNRYVLAPKLWSAMRRLPFAIRRSIGTLLAAWPAGHGGLLDRLGGALLGQAQFVAKLEKLGRRLSQVRSFDELYVSLVSEWPAQCGIVLGAECAAPLPEAFAAWRGLDDAAAMMMAADSETYLPDDILVKVDRAAMANSLETRIPFLDHRVFELAWRLPMSLKLGDGRGKLVLRDVLGRFVPPPLTERPKMGFGMPLDSWLRKELRAWGEDLLAETRLRADAIFDVAKVRSAWHLHLAGERDYGQRLWSVLMFQAWHAAGTGR